MGKLHKGKVVIRREELLDTFGLPADVEITNVSIDGGGSIEITIMTTDELTFKGRPVVYPAENFRDGQDFRRLVLTNRYKPVGKEFNWHKME